MTKARELANLLSQGQGFATQPYVDTKITQLVNGAPGTLDTLKEIADQLAVDESAVAAITTTLAGKANSSSLATVATTGSYTNLINKPTLFSGSYTDLTNKPTISAGNTLVNGLNQVVLGTDGNLTLPGNTSILTSEDSIAVVPDINKSTGIQVDAPGTGTNHVVTVQTNGNNWLFKSDGKIAFPDATQQSSAWTGTVDYSNVTNKPTVISLKGTSVTYPGDDLAADPAGAQTITITGTGFESTPTVYIGGTIAPSVTFVSSTQITVTTPAKAAGTYDIYIVNPGGATAIMVMGISYSGTPAWTTAAGSLGSQDGTFSIQLQATSNSAITYALASGSTLPSGVTLSSSGLITGTNVTTEQTFNFSVTAIDAENQDTSRSFSVTISLGDPYFKYVSLLLTGNGTGGTQNNTFIDSSTNNFTITRNGNTTQGTFSPYGSNWSNNFNGSSYFETPATTANYATGDFTIEAWVYYNAFTSGYTLWFSMDPNTTYFGPTSATNTKLNLSSGELNWTTSALSLNTWYHTAVVRSGTTITLYLDGVSQGTNTSSGTLGSAGGSIRIGSAAGYGLNGYLSNLRYTKSAVYINNFTPSTAPLTAISGTVLLTCQSNRFVDNSTNNFVITVSGTPSVQRFNPFGASTAYSTSVIGGSGYFDGSGDYVSVSNSGVLGTGDWMVELWVNAPVSQFDKPILELRDPAPGAGTTTGFTLTMLTGNIRIFSGSEKISGQANYVNQWLHIAIAKSSGTTTMYFNGVSVGTTTSLGSMTDTGFIVGAGYYGSTSITEYGNFYTSGMRVVKGSPVYTSNFTPPTAPAATVSNTAILMNYTNGAIFDNAMMNNLETVGNAQISTSVKKYGTGSIYIPGSGNSLKAPNTPNIKLPGDFTVEFWAYPISWTQYSPVLETRHADDTSSGLYIMIYNSGWTLYPFPQGAAATANTWQHIAFVRSGDTLYGFKDGVLFQSVSCPKSTYTYSGTGIFSLGYAVGDTSFTRNYNGYIDDLRITKGYARYTADFTPPTATFKLK